MRSILTLIIALVLFASADAGEKKSKWSWGAAPQWKWNCTSCPCESCPAAQPAAKPEATQVPEVKSTLSIESLTSSSCSSGSCGNAYSSGLFRRRR